MPSYGAFAAFYDGLTQNVSYEQRAEYFHRLLQVFQKEQPPGLLLDLACGTGSLSLAFARLGYEVIGVDGSAEMLSVAMQKAGEQEGIVPPLFLCQDMTALNLYGTVNAAVCALDSLNHLSGKKALLRTLERVRLFLDPGGIFLFDVNTPYKHREILGNNTFVYETDEVFCVWQNQLVGESDKVQITLDFFSVDAEKPKGEHYLRQREQFFEVAYSHEEMCALLEKAGLTLLGFWEEDSQNLPTPQAQRVVYAVGKPLE